MLAIVVTDHRHAAPRRTDHIGVIPKDLQELQRERARLPLAAGIGHRLSATRLLGRELDFHSGFFEQFHRRQRHVGIQLVDVARHKQTNPHRLHLLLAHSFFGCSIIDGCRRPAYYTPRRCAPEERNTLRSIVPRNNVQLAVHESIEDRADGTTCGRPAVCRTGKSVPGVP